MANDPWKPVDDCGICGRDLDDNRVFGLCRPCAEAKHASRQARKMLRKLVCEHNESR